MAALYRTSRSSLSGNFAAKSFTAFSDAAASGNAMAAWYASNSGCVLAAGGRFPCGDACALAACPAVPCVAGLSCPKLHAHIPSTAIAIAARFMRSPRLQRLNIVLEFRNAAFYSSPRTELSRTSPLTAPLPEAHTPAASLFLPPPSPPAMPPPPSVPPDTRSSRRRDPLSCPGFFPGTHATTPPLSDPSSPESPSESTPAPPRDPGSPPQPAPG